MMRCHLFCLPSLVPVRDRQDCLSTADRKELPASQTDFHHAKPIYEYLPGWNEDISGARKLSDLPQNAQAYIAFLEKISGAPMSAIGVGPGRDQTIVIKEFI